MVSETPDYAAFFARVVTDIRVGAGSQRYGRCPLHDDAKASFSFDIATGLWTCHGGCGDGHASALGARRGLPPEEVIALKPGRGGKEIEAVYPYVDEAGTLLYQALRYRPKEFKQRRPDGKGGWVWNLKDTRRVIYRLPDALDAIKRGEPIFLPEGEKDVENLWKLGLAASCNPQGAGKWRSEYSESMIGATVAILADNDDVGRDHAQQVARSLSGKAKSIKVIEIPNLPPKGDVSDWLSAGGTAAALKLIVDGTPEWQPSVAAPTRPSPSSDLPEIDISVKNLKALTQKGWDAICAWNEPPKIFRYGGLPTRIERNDEAALLLRDLNNDRVRHLLARVANWGYPIKDPKTGEIIGFAPAFPPNEVVRDILATPDKPLPMITRIVEIPIFGPDLRLQLAPGYYPSSRTFFSPPVGLVVPDVSLNPSREDIEKAKHLIVTELLGDFPFVGPSEIAHALCLLLLPFLRELIDGPTPLHDIEGPSAGTGKSLLIAVLAYPAIGGSLSMMSEATDEDEIRKRLTSKLRRGPSFIVIDNVRRRLDSGALASALTMQMWEDRLLGSSETLLLPIRTAWAVTANNPSFSNEIARRTIRIRLDSKQDRPWLRRNFRHKDLLAWTREHRGELIAAALTLIQAWIAAGRPAGSATLGSYENWARVFGGLFDVIGLPGFLANIEQVYETSDAEGSAWRGFIRAWWDKFSDREVGVAELFEISIRQDEPLDLGNGTDKAMKTRFGRLLVGARDRQFEGLRIVAAGTYQGAKMWRLAQTSEGGGELVNLGEPFPAPPAGGQPAPAPAENLPAPELPLATEPNKGTDEQKPVFFNEHLAKNPALRAHIEKLTGIRAAPEEPAKPEAEQVSANTRKKEPFWPV